MSSSNPNSASPLMVVFAFAVVYLVWGSTYFFIQKAVVHIPPFTLGASRFLLSGTLMAIWCLLRGENLFRVAGLKHALVSGILLLFFGNGIIIWVEQSIPSGLVSITVSSAPLWFILLDRPKWSENFKSRSILAGMIIGLAGVMMLFGEQVQIALNGGVGIPAFMMFLLVMASVTWAAGSLYSKYRTSSGSTSVNTTWQMLAAGVAFLPGAIIRHEWQEFNISTVPSEAWFSLVYLVLMGSIAGFSAYVWLLKVRSAMQVSTYAYVNPVVAVLLAVFFAGEKISLIQIGGLVVILGSVLLINLAKYRREKIQAARAASID